MTRRLGLNFIAALCLSAMMSALVGAASSTSPVADAVMRGDIDSVRTLLQQGADVNAPQGDGMTALHWAAQRGDAELTAMLVFGGANAGAVTRIGQYTPLHLASASTNAAVVEALIKAGANVAAKTTNTGATPLHMAAGAGQSPTIIKTLLDHGADVNAKESEWGQTPLIFAASHEPRRRRSPAPQTRRGSEHRNQDHRRGRRVGSRSRGAQSCSEGSRSVGAAGQKPTASQLQGAIQAARELLLSGKLPPPDPAPAAGDGRRWTRSELQPRRDQSAGRGERRLDRASSCGATGLRRVGARAHRRRRRRQQCRRRRTGERRSSPRRSTANSTRPWCSSRTAPIRILPRRATG